MSRILELPEETFEALEKVAKENGTTPLGWIQSRLPVTLLSQKPHNSSKTNNQTLADLFKGRVGTIQSGGGKTSYTITR